jgi:MFS family permease
MNTKRRTALQRMDALVGWSNGADKVRHDMVAEADARRRGPRRWLPLLPMAFGAGLVAAALTHAVPAVLYGVAGLAVAAGGSIATNGPLGKPAVDDDEREAALRRSAYFVCIALLACANIVGGPLVLVAAAWHGWGVARVLGIAFALFMANMTWFVSLPTLYASWKLPSLADDDA